jgi:homoserine kinase
VKAAALGAGALGCSFSGSGPSVFAWALERDADPVAAAMDAAFRGAGLAATAYRAPVGSTGVRLEAASARQRAA